MLTYQVRPRVLRLEGKEALSFPANGEIRFYFSPGQPFGTESGGGNTTVQNVGASVFFNMNTGKSTIESKQPLSPLDVTIIESERKIQMVGTTLTVTQSFESNQQLTKIIESLYFSIPMLLAVEFADPPIIVRVDGFIGTVKFRWELASWKGRAEITTQEKQEESVITAWKRIGLLSEHGRRRLLAALHYFHVGLRLARRSEIAGEFLPEMILNFSKVLEVLFPPTGDGNTRDAVRAGLRTLGFAGKEIEADYIPAMALRNEIDVGHVDLALFKVDQLAVIHGYVEHAESVFRELFKRIFEQIEEGSFDIEPYELKSVGGEALKVIERLQHNAERYAP